MEHFAWDVSLIAVLFCFAALCAKAAYWMGAPVWPRRFATPGLPDLPQLGLCSAEVGELANLALVAGVLVVLLVLTPDATVFGIVYHNRYWTGGVFIAICAATTLYAFIAPRRASEQDFLEKRVEFSAENLALLRRGYVFYAGYCAVICCLGMLIFLVTLWQIQHDSQKFREADAIINHLYAGLRGATMLDAETLQRQFEVIYGRQQVAEGYILDQVNTLLMLLLCIISAFLIIYRTSVRQVFAEGALSLLKSLIILLVGTCIVWGCYVFFTLHIRFVDQMLVELRGYETVMNMGSWQVTQRYHEMLADLSRQRGVFGFLVALSTGRGGLVLVAPVIGWLLGSVVRTKPQAAE